MQILQMILNGIKLFKITEENVSKNVTDEQKVELEQRLHLDKQTKNCSVDEHDFQSGSASLAMQEVNTERYKCYSCFMY